MHSIWFTICFPLHFCLNYSIRSLIHDFIQVWSTTSHFKRDFITGLPEGYIGGGMVRPYGENTHFSNSIKCSKFGITVYLHVLATCWNTILTKNICISKIIETYVPQDGQNYVVFFHYFIKNPKIHV